MPDPKMLTVEAAFEICGLKCVTCAEEHFTHVTEHTEAAAWGEQHKGHEFIMDCFYTKPPQIAGKRCRVSTTLKGEAHAENSQGLPSSV